MVASIYGRSRSELPAWQLMRSESKINRLRKIAAIWTDRDERSEEEKVEEGRREEEEEAEERIVWYLGRQRGTFNSCGIYCYVQEIERERREME